MYEQIQCVKKSSSWNQNIKEDQIYDAITNGKSYCFYDDLGFLVQIDQLQYKHFYHFVKLEDGTKYCSKCDKVTIPIEMESDLISDMLNLALKSYIEQKKENGENIIDEAI